MDIENCVSLQEAADLINIPKALLRYYFVNRRFVEGVFRGNQWLFDREAVLAWKKVDMRPGRSGRKKK